MKGNSLLSFRSSPNIKNVRRRWIVGLDHGTTWTAGGFLLVDDSTNHVKANIVYPFRRYPRSSGSGKQGQSTEIPSIIEYDGSCIKIGFEANNTWSHSRVTVHHAKLGLDPNPAFAAEREILYDVLKMVASVLPKYDANSEVRVTAERVIEDLFTILFSQWKNELIAIGFHEGDNVELNCAVPAAWKTTDPVHKLLEIVDRAGLRSNFHFDKQVRFWPEPEAALAHLLVENPNIDLKPGQIVLICDGGGGTTDITVYKVLDRKNLTLEEVSISEGAWCGSQFLDEGFRKHILARLKHATNISEDQKEKWMNSHALPMFRTTYKVSFDGTLDPPHRLFFFGTLDDNKEQLFEDGTIILTAEHMREIFEPVVSTIVDLVRKQIEEVQKKGLKTDMAVLVGGLAGSPYLNQRIQTALDTMNMSSKGSKLELFRPEATPHAVAAGSIYCAIKPVVGHRRRNRCSIGIKVLEKHEPNRYPGHVGREPERDVTGNYFVKSLNFLLRKGEYQPEESIEQEFTIEIEEELDFPTIAVKLYRSDTRIDDHYAPLDCDLWDEISFVVDMSKIRPLLKKKLDKRRKAKRRKLPPPTRRSGRLIGKYAELTLDRSLSQLSLHSDSGYATSSNRSSSTRVSDATSSGSVADDVVTEPEDDEESRGSYYYDFHYIFRISFDGLLAKYQLECSIANLTVAGERNMAPVYSPGTC